ncbi:hypothetical protein Tco_0964107, partial [Tanacetum coccineum]
MPPRRNMNINDVYEQEFKQRVKARMEERLDQFVDQLVDRMNYMMNPKRRGDHNGRGSEGKELENSFFDGDGSFSDEQPDRPRRNQRDDNRHWESGMRVNILKVPENKRVSLIATKLRGRASTCFRMACFIAPVDEVSQTEACAADPGVIVFLHIGFTFLLPGLLLALFFPPKANILLYTLDGLEATEGSLRGEVASAKEYNGLLEKEYDNDYTTYHGPTFRKPSGKKSKFIGELLKIITSLHRRRTRRKSIGMIS